MPAHASGDEFVYCGINRSILAAYAGACKRTEQGEAEETPRERGQRGRCEVKGNGDGEEFLTSPTISEITKDQRAQHGPGQVVSSTQAKLRIGEAQGIRAL